MKKHVLLTLAIAVGVSSIATVLPLGRAADWRIKKSKDLDTPIVFQAAGPTAESIQSSVDVSCCSGRTQQRQ
jgi:hypothetical protein